jgi:hypothetical protein
MAVSDGLVVTSYGDACLKDDETNHILRGEQYNQGYQMKYRFHSTIMMLISVSIDGFQHVISSYRE